VISLNGEHFHGLNRAKKLLQDKKVKYGQLKRIIHDIQNIDTILSSYTPDRIKQIQDNFYNYWVDNFTMKSICQKIINRI
jgi:hypothetical protein